jgi:hypothetical protein
MIKLPTAKEARRITVGKKKRIKELLFVLLAEAIDEGKHHTWVGFKHKEKALKALKKLNKLDYACEIDYVGYPGIAKKMCKYRLRISW